jgi:hypothetical protein
MGMKQVGCALVLTLGLIACSSGHSSTHTRNTGAVAGSTGRTVTTTTQPTSTSLPLSADDIAQRNHPLKALSFPAFIDSKLIAHHSGGPYVGMRRVVDDVLAGFRCKLGGPQQGFPKKGCLQVDVRFFAHYADWWRVEGGQTQFVVSWGPDREMYAVTIYGRLAVETTKVGQHGPIFVPWHTVQIDATTGRTMMSGGLPLPEHFPGVRTFR